MYRIAAALAFLAAIALVYFLVDPVAGILPECPFYKVTHLYCPGCGSQRAVHALLHGEMAASLAYNPLLLVAVIYSLVEGILWLRRRFDHRIRPLSSYRWAPWIALGMISAFWVLRNIPVEPFTALAP